MSNELASVSSGGELTACWPWSVSYFLLVLLNADSTRSSLFLCGFLFLCVSVCVHMCSPRSFGLCLRLMALQGVVALGISALGHLLHLH